MADKAASTSAACVRPFDLLCDDAFDYLVGYVCDYSNPESAGRLRRVARRFLACLQPRQNQLHCLALKLLHRRTGLSSGGLAACVGVDMSGASLSSLDFAVLLLSPVFSRGTQSSQLKNLVLPASSLGDSGVALLTATVVGGGLRGLANLDLSANGITSVDGLVQACTSGSGCLLGLQHLLLHRNTIGGADKLVEALASVETLPRLGTLFVDENPLTTRDKVAVATACDGRGVLCDINLWVQEAALHKQESSEAVARKGPKPARRIGSWDPGDGPCAPSRPLKSKIGTATSKATAAVRHTLHDLLQPPWHRWHGRGSLMNSSSSSGSSMSIDEGLRTEVV